MRAYASTMNTVLIFFGAQLIVSVIGLWGFLAMARWSDRQLAIAWRQRQESKQTYADLD